jgi:chromosome segregation ATPase
MTAVAFDTLKLARKLEAAGFPAKQAADTSQALAEALTEEVASKSDISLLRSTVESQIAALRADIDAKITALRADIDAKITALRADIDAKISAFRAEMDAHVSALRAEIEAVRADMEKLEMRLTIKLGGMMVVAVGVVAALVKLL